jgi:hypothetical protein
MDATQMGVLIGSVCGAIGALGGGICTWGVAAYLKVKADKREDIRLQDQRDDADETKEDGTLRYIIGRQDGEIAALKAKVEQMQASHTAELKNVHELHNACELRYTALDTEMKVRLELMGERVRKMEDSSRFTVEVVPQDGQQGAAQQPKGKS